MYTLVSVAHHVCVSYSADDTHKVLYSRDHKGVGMAHEIISPKNKKTALISPDDDEAVLIR